MSDAREAYKRKPLYGAEDPCADRIEALEAEVERLTEERDGIASDLRYLREVREPGGCQCSDDDACRFARERDEARAEVERLTAALARRRRYAICDCHPAAIAALEVEDE